MSCNVMLDDHLVCSQSLSCNGKSHANIVDLAYTPKAMQINSSYRAIEFLQSQHAAMIKDLHREIESLQQRCRDLQFKLEFQNELYDESVYKDKIFSLEEQIQQLKDENIYTKAKLLESTNKSANLYEQKQKLHDWQHEQELEERDKVIFWLQHELDAKCSALDELNSELHKEKNKLFKKFTCNDNHSLLAPFKKNFICKGTAVKKQVVHAPQKVKVTSSDDTHKQFSELKLIALTNIATGSTPSDKDASSTSTEIMEDTFQPPEVSNLRRFSSIKSVHLPIVSLPPINPPNSIQSSANRTIVRQQLRINKKEHLLPSNIPIDQRYFNFTK